MSPQDGAQVGVQNGGCSQLGLECVQSSCPPHPNTWQPHPFSPTAFISPAATWPSPPTCLPLQPSTQLKEPFSFTPCWFVIAAMLLPCLFFLLLNSRHLSMDLKLDRKLSSYLCQYLRVSLSLPVNHWNPPAASSVCVRLAQPSMTLG